ncbi:MAG: response regulator transcription factor [Flavobacteriaceae bacterium]|nr:response regulator transcription factor [Flavobacteriaceae bacterium]MDZ4147075.1 response regulator transcription factor [Flavobacteriaceae bacterium]
MNKRIKIIYAEDEPALGQIVKESLETRDFEVRLCTDGEAAFREFQTQKPDVLVLDVMMPKQDGFSLAKAIRKENTEIPIVFLTAKSQVADVVEGFHAGGNDYLKKPFSMEELIVRIHALLGRIGTSDARKQYAIGKYLFDVNKQTLTLGNQIQPLTHRESALLHELLIQKNQLLERAYILNKIWGDDDFFAARSMDVFVSKLRKKLQADATVEIINLRGFGYKLVC